MTNPKIVTLPNPAAEFRALIERHGMTQAQAAEVACVSVKTVESWLAPIRSASHRTMPSRALKLFKLNLPTHLKENKP